MCSPSTLRSLQGIQNCCIRNGSHGRGAEGQQGKLLLVGLQQTWSVSVQRLLNQFACCLQIFGGWNKRFKHKSDVLGCEMKFSLFFPPAATESRPAPVRVLPSVSRTACCKRLVIARQTNAASTHRCLCRALICMCGIAQVLYFLSGLTCTDENVMTKSGIQRKAAEEGIAIIAPDTSPRGLNMCASARSSRACCPLMVLIIAPSICMPAFHTILTTLMAGYKSSWHEYVHTYLMQTYCARMILILKPFNVQTSCIYLHGSNSESSSILACCMLSCSS